MTGFESYLCCVLFFSESGLHLIDVISCCMRSDKWILASRWNSFTLSESLSPNFKLLQMSSCCQKTQVSCRVNFFYYTIISLSSCSYSNLYSQLTNDELIRRSASQHITIFLFSKHNHMYLLQPLICRDLLLFSILYYSKNIVKLWTVGGIKRTNPPPNF